MKAAFVDVKGMRMRYLYEGVRKSGPPLILLHGFFDNAQTWWRSIDDLAEDRPVYAPDLVGHGFSDLVDLRGEPPQAAAVAVLTAWVDRMGWESFDIGGCSFGGLVSALMVFERPASVRRLIISGSAQTFESADVIATMMDEALRHMLPILQDATVEKLRAWMAGGIGGPSAHLDVLLPGLLTSYARPGATEFIETAIRANYDNGEMRRLSVVERLEDITAPTRVLWGRNDRRPWQSAAAAAKRLPNAEFTVLDDCGHLAHLTNPPLWNKLVGDFLRLA